MTPYTTESLTQRLRECEAIQDLAEQRAKKHFAAWIDAHGRYKGPNPWSGVAPSQQKREIAVRLGLILDPVGDPCSLDECPPGPFRGESGGLGFKTEYGRMIVVPESCRSGKGSDLRWAVGNGPDVYCLDSGEAWCSTTMVQPLEVQNG